MYDRMLLCSTLFLCALQVPQQAAEVDIARWYGNADAAVSLMLDDYGRAFFGDMKLIEEIATETGVKLSFGVNTHIDTDRAESIYGCWETARRMTKHGHEFHSHSATHNGADWSGPEMKLQVDDSTAAIEKNIPGWKSYFFIFPNKGKDNNGIENELQYMREHAYIGARSNAGRQHVGFPGATNGDVPDPFHVSTIFWREGVSVETILNKNIKLAIQKGAWATPSFHNVNKRSWGTISGDEFRRICMGIQKEVSAGKLWSAGVQRALSYALARNAYQAAIKKKGTGYEITLEQTSKKIAASPMISDDIFTQPLTLIIDPGKQSISSAQQGKQRLTITQQNGTLLINVNPRGGSISLR